MKIYLLSAETVVKINKKVCLEGKNPHHCFGEGKVSSALHSAYYPGSAPFVHGGISGIAGALLYYICQAHAFQDGNKRTASLACLVTLNASGFDLKYPCDEQRDDFSELVIAIACGEATIDRTKAWIKTHLIAQTIN